MREHRDEALRHPKFRKDVPQVHQRGNDALAIGWQQSLLGYFAHLWRVEAHPNLTNVFVRRPEANELLEVTVALCLLTRDGAVHRDLVPPNVLENPIVGGRCSPHIVLGLEPVDRDDQLQARQRAPLDGKRSHCAGDDLRIDAFFGEPREDLIQLTETDERLSADDRHVQRIVFVDELEKPFDEFLSLVIADLAQRHLSAEVLITVGVTAGAAQRALSRDFNRQGGAVAAQNSSPRRDNPFHARDYITGAIFRLLNSR